MINPTILFEDDFLLVLDKPAGVVVNRAESVKDEETIQDWINENFKFGVLNPGKKAQIKTTFEERSGILHRLDRETSGILLVAKNESMFEEMISMFKNRAIHKKYLALVHGETEKAGLLNFKIGRYNKKGKFVVTELGKDALTEYKSVSRFSFNENSLNEFLRKNYDRLKEKYDLKKYTLVEIKLHTGRTHQIRVHFSHIHHPVAGDKLYGWHKVINFEKAWCPRQFLHAAEINFIHPITQADLIIKSDLPSELKNIQEKYLININ